MSGLARRDQLIAVAAAVLEDDGLERLSMGAIARRAGIRTPSLLTSTVPSAWRARSSTGS